MSVIKNNIQISDSFQTLNILAFVFLLLHYKNKLLLENLLAETGIRTTEAEI